MKGSNAVTASAIRMRDSDSATEELESSDERRAALDELVRTSEEMGGYDL